MACEIKPLAGGGFAIIYSRGRKPRALCQEPGCINVHSKLCDWPTKESNPDGTITTCDRRICDDHAASGGPDIDYCPAHAWEKGLVGGK